MIFYLREKEYIIETKFHSWYINIFITMKRTVGSELHNTNVDGLYWNTTKTKVNDTFRGKMIIKIGRDIETCVIKIEIY